MIQEYSNFKELKDKEFGNYFIECIDVGSKITIIAPHGGRIELRTDIIAKSIACQDFNYYGFISKRGKVKDKKNMHITSHMFDEPIALTLVGKSEIVVAIHGCTDIQEIKQGDTKIEIDFGKHIFIGGKDEVLKDKLEDALANTGLSIGREKFAGEEKDNICNRGTIGAGIQFELTRSFRDDGDLCKLFIKTVTDVLIKNISTE